MYGNDLVWMYWKRMRICVQLSATEVANIVNGFEENSLLPQNGLFIGGAKYMVLQGDQGIVIRGKKVTISAIFVNDILKRFKIRRCFLNLWYFVCGYLSEVWPQLMDVTGSRGYYYQEDSERSGYWNLWRSMHSRRMQHCSREARRVPTWKWLLNVVVECFSSILVPHVGRGSLSCFVIGLGSSSPKQFLIWKEEVATTSTYLQDKEIGEHRECGGPAHITYDIS